MATAKEVRSGLTQERLRSLLSYDAETGIFRWIRQPEGSHKPIVGAQAGSILRSGHRQICVDGVKYFAARLAWLWMTGSWPEKFVDHRDLHPSNDAWSNLRESTRQGNSANRSAYRGSRTGMKGVQFRDGRKNPWIAQIRVENRLSNLGSFSTKEEAAAAYLRAAVTAFGEFARAGIEEYVS